MKPYTSTLRSLARVTAPWMVALSAGVSPPAVRIPILFMASALFRGNRPARVNRSRDRRVVNSRLVPLRVALLPALLAVCLAPVRTASAAGPDAAPPLDPLLAEARALINAGRPAAALEKLQAAGATPDDRVALLRGVAYYHDN